MFSKTFTVTEADLAVAMGSGSLPVFATPRLVADMENTAVAALEDSIPAGKTTVGAHMAIDHRKPSVIGETVTITADIVEQTERKAVFHMTATASGHVIAEADHVRVVVDSNDFVTKANAAAEK